MSERPKLPQRIKPAYSLLCLLVMLAVAMPAFADTVLEPGKVITLTFPNLPPTLFALKNPAVSGPTTISVRLPDNYSKERSFPLFVYLHGGWGNKGSEVETPMAMVGKTNYVLASFPSFKTRSDPEEMWGGIGIEFAECRRACVAVQLLE